MGIIEGFIYGVAGGFLAELLGIFKLRSEVPAELPKWIKSPFYWIVTGAMIVAGGGIVIIYLKSNIEIQPLIAINVGASAPLIIGTLVSQAPKVTKTD